MTDQTEIVADDEAKQVALLRSRRMADTYQDYALNLADQLDDLMRDPDEEVWSLVVLNDLIAYCRAQAARHAAEHGTFPTEGESL